MTRNGAIVLFVALATVGIAGIGVAQSDAEGGSVSKQQAADTAGAGVDGTAKKAVKENEGGPVYEVQVEDPDRSMGEVEVDGNTGAVPEVESAAGELM